MPGSSLKPTGAQIELSVFSPLRPEPVPGSTSTVPPLTPSPPCQGESDSVALRFHAFFSEREGEKRRLYGQAVLVGLALGSVGGAGFCLQALMGALGLSSDAVTSTFSLASATFSCGICLMSIVPTDEFNVDKDTDRDQKSSLGPILRAALGTLCAGFGLFNVLFVFPYVQGFPCILAGLATFASLLCRRGREGGRGLFSVRGIQAAAGTGPPPPSATEWGSADASGSSCGSKAPLFSTYLLLMTLACFTNWTGIYVAMAVQAVGPLISPAAGASGTFDFPGSYYAPLAPLLSQNRVLGVALFCSKAVVFTTILLAALMRVACRPAGGVGWRTSRFYVTMHLFMAAIGAMCLIEGAIACYSTLFTSAFSRALGLFVSFIILLPISTYFSLGSRRCFALLARAYELDLARQQRDGALLSELVSSTQVLDLQSHRRWVKRRSPCAAPAAAVVAPTTTGETPCAALDAASTTTKGAVVAGENVVAARRARSTHCSFWMLGLLQEGEGVVNSSSILLKIAMKDDVALQQSSVVARYHGNSLVVTSENGAEPLANCAPPEVEGAPHSAAPPPPFPRDEFVAWASANFEDADVVRLDSDACSVVVRAPLAISGRGRRELQAAASAGLRCLRIHRFENGAGYDARGRLVATVDLFSNSPRQLASEAEKEATFGLSTPAVVRSHAGKIDLFVSHSWEDGGPLAAARKFERLREALLQHAPRSASGGCPSVWLDKVCVDQRSPMDAIAVLPIIIGTCKEVLVLMSRSYLMRLWCIWELFTLFTFCNRELALERIRLVSIEDEHFDMEAAIRDFDVDEATCFDPNEEFKLRQIMHDIGSERVQAMKDSLAVVAARAAASQKAWCVRRRGARGR